MKHALHLMVFLVLTACGQKKPAMTPVEYNDVIVGEQVIITRLVDEMANAFSTDIAESEKYRIQLVKQCEQSVDKIKNMPDYKGNTRFRDAGVALFSFYKDISEKEFKEIINILNQDKIEDADIALLEFLEIKIGSKEDYLVGEFEATLQAFAKEHNLSLYENEIQREIDELGK